MLKYNSVAWGSERRTFPRNCQKTTLESTEMSVFRLSLADEKGTCVILPHCLLQSICRSVTLWAIYPCEAVAPGNTAMPSVMWVQKQWTGDMSVHTSIKQSYRGSPTLLPAMSMSPNI